MMDALEQAIATTQRFSLEQAAIDATRELHKGILKLTPPPPAMGQFLFHLLTILESAAASAKGSRALPGLHDCERNHREFLAAPADAIRDRLTFASRLLSQFAQYAGAMTAADAAELEKRMEAALQGDPQDPPRFG